MENNIDIQKISNIVSDIIYYDDNSEAFNILQQIKDLNDSRLEEIKTHLKIVAFSNLSDEESADILRQHYLESFEIGVNIANKIESKLFMIPLEVRDELREQLKRAILENKQKIGTFSIGEWILKFEQKFPQNNMNKNSIINFINNSEAQNLTSQDKYKLKEMLLMYDYFLVYTLPATGQILDEMLADKDLTNTEQIMSSNISNTFYSSLNEDGDNTSKNETLNISDALKKFPELGEQLITSMRIKLKSFPEPVRPSINNWLSDYTFNLGFESHSAMDRGTYLFRNENAKILNSTDREKISFILKAYDENSLVDVNVNTKQIVFPKREQAVFNGGSTSKREVEPPRTPYQTPQRNVSEIYNARLQKDQPKDIFEKEREASENKNTGNINFSSPQKLPYEKQNAQSPQSQNISHVHTPLQNQSPRPMRISSQNLRDSSEETQRTRINPNVPPGNIVNLKDKQ